MKILSTDLSQSLKMKKSYRKFTKILLRKSNWKKSSKTQNLKNLSAKIKPYLNFQASLTEKMQGNE